MREANIYSEYYGLEDIASSERLVTKSNCNTYGGSEKTVKSPSSKNTKLFYKKSTSKSKCKKDFHSPSPSNKDITLRFKKKKYIEVK
jgi:hypothetical protein